MIEYIKSKKGAIGIGTLIVFIAMVLVAAVAASVLISTSGFLQQKASATGRQSTEQVSSGINVIEIHGMHNNTSVTKIAILIRPNAGGSPIDLGQTVVMLSDGEKRIIARYNGSKLINIQNATNKNNRSLFDAQGGWPDNKNEFGIIVIQDADNSCKNAPTPVINQGDIVALTLNTSNLDMTPRSTITGTIQPEFGAPGIISFTTPSAYLDTVPVVQLQ